MSDTGKPTVAKRRLSDIDFSKEGSHLALVHKVQGGAASGYSTLITKATKDYSPEFIQKASQVKVTMELPEFLEKFFHVWGDDALLLATMFGYTPSEDSSSAIGSQSFWSYWREKCAAEGNLDYWGDTPPATEQDKMEWVQGQLNSVEVLKAAQSAENITDYLAQLEEEDHLKLLQDQEWIEKSFKPVVGNKQPSPQEDVPQNTQAELEAVTKAVKAKPTTKEGKVMSDTPNENVDVLKAKEVELQKALDRIEQLEKKEAEVVAKARLDAIGAVVDNEDNVKALFKAVGALDAEDFDAVLTVLKAQTPLEEKDKMFKEQGSPQEGVEVAKAKQQDAVMAILHQEFNK